MLLRLQKIRRRIREAYDNVRITYMYANNGVKFRKPTAEERRLVIGVHDLIQAGYPIEFDTRREVWIARTFPDGDFEVKYTYDYEDESSLARFLMITRIEVAKDFPGAEELFQDGISAREAGAATVGGRFVFKGNLQSWSENAYGALSLAQPNETVVGCVLSFQKERLVYTIILRGMYFEDAAQVEEIVYPHLEAALAWSRRDA
jgi:hypothetical protein